MGPDTVTKLGLIMKLESRSRLVNDYDALETTWEDLMTPMVSWTRKEPYAPSGMRNAPYAPPVYKYK